MIRRSNRRVKMLDNKRMTMKSSELFWRRFDLEFEFFYIPSSPFFLAVFWPFIGRIARYTPSSRPQNASKIKANLEFHKSSDDFYNVYRAEHWRVTNHKRYAHRERSYGLFLYRRWLLQSFFWRRGGRVCRLGRIMEDVSFLCILFIFAFSPFPIRQNCDLPHFWRMGFFSWLRQCVTLSHPIELRNSLIFNIRNLMRQKVMKSGNISNVAHTRPSTPRSLFVRICQRTWNEPQTHTGADTNAPGSRRSRIWEQTRTFLGAETVESGTMFADWLRGRIDETFLQYNND